MKVDLLTCKVRIAGDLRMVNHYQRHNALTWPEYCVIRTLHGDENVEEGSVVDTIERDQWQEYERLTATYGKGVVSHLWPGVDGYRRMIGTAPDYIPREEPPPPPPTAVPETKKSTKAAVDAVDA